LRPLQDKGLPWIILNAALLMGFWRWISRNRQGIWDPTARAPFLESAGGSA